MVRPATLAAALLPLSLRTAPATSSATRALSISAMSSAPPSQPAPEEAPSSSSSEPKKEPLALPAAGTASDIPQLDLSSGGSTVKLDTLGPMVVNVDGTLSRISNWDKMTEVEQKNTLRIIGKRNQQRLEALKAAEGSAGKGEL